MGADVPSLERLGTVAKQCETGRVFESWAVDYPRQVPTRHLLIMAAFTAVAILVAGALWLLAILM